VCTVRLRVVVLAGVLVSVVVTALTLPRVPAVSPWPLLLGLLPWLAGKYLLCPLRWWVVSAGAAPAGWHLRTFAEAELLGMLTPGHVGSDCWRVHRLAGRGTSRADALVSVGLDRLVGGIALAGFVVAASATLPVRMLTTLAVLAGVAGVVALVARRRWPRLAPSQPLPGPGRLAAGLALSAGYQLSIAALLLGILAGSGNAVSPLALVGAFGAAQVAGAVPGPHGASPRDAALVVTIAALGVPWSVAAAAVALKAVVAWCPAVALGGASLWLTRRGNAREPVPTLARCTSPPPTLSRSTAW
jgi:glycosyltransferase 2 family protein